MKDVRKDFPILKRKIKGKRLVYLDSAATSQKPIQVIDAIKDFYENHNSNVNRGVHTLSEEATEMLEKSREKVASFVNAETPEVIFTRNATEAINLVSFTWAMKNLDEGNEILITEMEHHANLVPWQQFEDIGVKLNFARVTEEGILDMNDFQNKINKNTKLVAFSHVSNVLGTINDVKKMTRIAHDAGAKVLLDAAQSVPHMPVDMKSIGCDFLAFSGHKMLAPSGIGCLCASKEILENMEPFMRGGDMIREVHFDSTKWNDVPWKFEAGTPNIEGAIGIGAAVDYLEKIGMKEIAKHEQEIIKHAMKKASSVKEMKVYGPKERGGILAFNVADIHSHDMASLLNEEGIAIRSGHHCAQPLHEKLNIPTSARASFYIYNDKKDVDALFDGIEKAKKVFKVK